MALGQPQWGAPPPYTPGNHLPQPPPSNSGWDRDPSSRPQATPGTEPYHYPPYPQNQLYQYQQPPQPYHPGSPAPTPWPSHQHPIHPHPAPPLGSSYHTPPLMLPYQQLQYRHPSQPTHSSSPTPGPGPFARPGFFYPYLTTASNQMTLFNPDHTTPLLTVKYPSDWSSQLLETPPKLSIYRGGPGDVVKGKEIGGVQFHEWSTDKVDAFFYNPDIKGGGGEQGAWLKYRFKKKFDSQTGLWSSSGPTPPGRLVWGVSKKEGGMVLTREREKKSGGGMGWLTGRRGKEEGQDEVLVRFVVAGDQGAKKLKDESERMEGRLEVMRPGGLSQVQLEEVFVTLVAEMERVRWGNGEWDIVEDVLRFASQMS